MQETAEGCCAIGTGHCLPLSEYSVLPCTHRDGIFQGPKDEAVLEFLRELRNLYTGRGSSGFIHEFWVVFEQNTWDCRHAPVVLFDVPVVDQVVVQRAGKN